MGKHKSEKSKKKRRRDSSDSSSEEWVEREPSKRDKSPDTPTPKRGEWMDLPTSFLSTSNSERRQDRREKERQKREKEKYNPQESSRELNPYWKDGGDGLPKFKKPVESEDNYQPTSERKLNWKKKDSKIHEASSTAAPEKTFKKDDKCSDSNEQSVASTPEDLNQLGAKLIKAEIMGNLKLVNELKQKLEEARTSQVTTRDDHVLLTVTDNQGRTIPLKSPSEHGESSRKKKKVETHREGQRVRYFADDDKYSLKQMFESEKYNTTTDHNWEFINMTKKVHKNEDLEDMFTDEIRKKSSDTDAKNVSKAISEQERRERSLDNCSRCLQSDVMQKHLMVSMRDTVYLSLPQHVPLTDGHCLISPIKHVTCSTQLDENEWEDLTNLQKSLTEMFKQRGEDVIFFEYAIGLHRFPHMYIECVPIPLEESDNGPIYFKKAIDECEEEWAQNKKLISLKGKDVRRAVPKGLPYFFVSFGTSDGYAHVIEDERMFPRNFAQEIIGGMLDLHHSKWRKPKWEKFEEQSKRVTEFSKEWKHFETG